MIYPMLFAKMTSSLMASDAPAIQTPIPQVILGNGNRRFSGVTSTLLQVLPHQMESMEIAVLGRAHMPSSVRTLGFVSALRLLRRAAMDRKPVVFHARRNIEIVQALILRRLGASTLKIAFTSTAQRYHSKFTRYLMRQMDSVISTCSAAAGYLDPPPDQLIPHGIDTARFHPRPKGEPPRREALGTARQIGIFGRVRHQKGIDVLIEAAIPILLERPDWGILVVGEIKPEDTSYVDELKRRVNEAGLNERINFTGLRPFSTLPGFFRYSDIVAALSRNEGYGLTVLEAMSSGCAVIASTAGAWPDIITHGETGLLVPIADVEATRASLIDLIDHEEVRITMGGEARSQVLAQYRVEDEAQALCRWYQTLIQGAK